MFIRGDVPAGENVSHQGQGVWGASQTPAFAFDLANPNLLLKQNLHNLYLASGKQAAFRSGPQNMATSGGGNNNQAHGNLNMKEKRTESQKYHLQANDFDQSMVWSQNMEDPNDAFRGPTGSAHGQPAPGNGFSLGLAGQNSNNVSPSSSGNNNHRHIRGNARARRPNNVSPSTGGLKTEPNTANITNTKDIAWNVPSSAINPNVNVNALNQTFAPPPITVRALQQWPGHAPVPNNEYMQHGYSLHDGLPVFQNNQGFPQSFDLGPAIGGVPNLDSSSSSSCRVNGSSPNTVFGSFSSSIGPADMDMDMDMREEYFHSPSVFPSEVPLCHSTGSIPQAYLSGSPAHDFPANTRGVFPEAETVSPDMLHFNPSAPVFPSSSSSESLSHPFRIDSDSEVPSSVGTVPQKDILPSSVWQARREANNKVNTADRKQLPDKAPRPKHGASSTGNSSGSKRRHGGDATGDKSSAPSSKKTKSKAKATSQSSHSSHHSDRTQQVGGCDDSGSGSSNSSSSGAGHKTLSSSSSKAIASTTGASPSAAAMVSSATMNPRSEKDEYLVRSKRAGMTYKEIRKQGGFTEAESTLRGRFRTLTKPKEARVRKPEFQEIDDKLLKRAVIKLTKDVDEITRDNVPWKLVSEYMASHGGSYHFGYTTVRKRWEYLMATSEEEVKQDRLAHKFQQ
ncbi:hypothetical protein KVR01_007826 [Diaporthe batatas]|uniref:uncharacterized protein n=1 Tax=Diaporthe batatas TaxID=748121 RepID=UPI001D04357E|nr:uncharacterized protein KVR01_007826 [Diaporthe batatas]KAG8162061.1 hypothetical protein KVR01_007826 [Diaporthe batatas]